MQCSRNDAHGFMKLGVNQVCVSRSWPNRCTVLCHRVAECQCWRSKCWCRGTPGRACQHTKKIAASVNFCCCLYLSDHGRSETDPKWPLSKQDLNHVWSFDHRVRHSDTDVLWLWRCWGRGYCGNTESITLVFCNQWNLLQLTTVVYQGLLLRISMYVHLLTVKFLCCSSCS